MLGCSNRIGNTQPQSSFGEATGLASGVNDLEICAIDQGRDTMDISAELAADRQTIVLTVTRQEWIGKDVSLTLYRRAEVFEKDGVDSESKLYATRLTLSGVRGTVVLHTPLSEPDYSGQSLRLYHRLHLVVNDGVFFDSTLDVDLPMTPLLRPSLPANSAQWIQPPDRYSLRANLRALAPLDRLKALGMIVVCGVLMLVNMIVGVRDSSVPESQVWFYDHSGTKDGRRTHESPVMKAGTGSAMIGVGAFGLLLRILRRYMRFELKQRTFPRRGARVRAAEIIHGVARVPLEGAVVRIVAANREYGKVRRTRNKKTEVVSYTKASSAVILFEQQLGHLPAHTPLENSLIGDVNFDLAYESLYPPLSVGDDHGVGLVWEAQLLHPELVDQEAEGTTRNLSLADFLDPAGR